MAAQLTFFAESSMPISSVSFRTALYVAGSTERGSIHVRVLPSRLTSMLCGVMAFIFIAVIGSKQSTSCRTALHVVLKAVSGSDISPDGLVSDIHGWTGGSGPVDCSAISLWFAISEQSGVFVSPSEESSEYESPSPDGSVVSDSASASSISIFVMRAKTSIGRFSK